MSRAKTAEEVRGEFLNHVRGIATYWANLPNKTAIKRCEGVVFSMLVLLDGASIELPAFNLSLRPHEEDKQFCIDNKEDYYEPGMVMNDDCHLHDLLWVRRENDGDHTGSMGNG